MIILVFIHNISFSMTLYHVSYNMMLGSMTTLDIEMIISRVKSSHRFGQFNRALSTHKNVIKFYEQPQFFFSSFFVELTEGYFNYSSTI